MSAGLELSGDLDERSARLARRFDVTPRFVSSYLAARPHVRSAVEAARDEAELFDLLGPLTGTYVRFALTTTERGHAFLALVAPHAGTPRRFLDVGCAYGGFLRAAREQGAEVVGVEIEPSLAGLARDNLGDGSGVVHAADVLGLSPAALGTFDLVACNDVIEHVASGEALVMQVARLLRPGGHAYFEIPNPHALSFVARDGHYQQFGVTLLPRALAARVVGETLGKDYADMGELHEEAQIRRWFAAAGLRPVDVVQPHAQPWDQSHRLIFDLVNAFTWWHDHEALALSGDLREAIVDGYWNYAERLFADYARARRGDGRVEFERRYLASFWTFLLVRPTSHAARPTEDRAGGGPIV